MRIALIFLGLATLLGGTWAFLQSPSGTQFPVPIAIGGFCLLAILFFGG